MYPANLNDITNPDVRERVAVERRIVRALVTHALKEGYELSVHDGEEEHPWTRDYDAVIDAIMNTDEDTLRLRKDGKNSFVFFVYGNSGWDVICDYSVSLEEVIRPILDMAERLEAAQ